jgi:DNA-binding HxlR family transcriptional regulator
MKVHGLKMPESMDPATKSQLCPIVYAVSKLGGKWKLIVVHNLIAGPKRFGELRRAIPDITQRMLTLTLRELEEDGIVNREVFEVVPPHVEYSLTAVGQDLENVMSSLGDWGRANFAQQRNAVA